MLKVSSVSLGRERVFGDEAKLRTSLRVVQPPRNRIGNPVDTPIHTFSHANVRSYLNKKGSRTNRNLVLLT